MARKSRKNLPQPEQAMVSVQFPDLDDSVSRHVLYHPISIKNSAATASNRMTTKIE